MRHKPFITVLVGGNPVAAAFYERLSTATITDNAGQDADTLELVFDDSGNTLVMPEKGAKLHVSFGYRDVQSWMMGEFTVEKSGISFDQGGDLLTLSAHSTDLRADVKEQASEHFEETTIGDIVEQLARRHGYDAKISPDLASRPVPYMARVGQSAMDFLTRLADRNQALFSIKANRFLFLKRGSLPAITITKSMCESGSVEVEPRARYGKIEASWFDRAKGRNMTATHETGLDGPMRRLRKVFTSQAEAEAATASEGDRLCRATGTGSLSLFGTPEIMADSPLILTGFRPEMNGEWRAGTVTHTYSADSYKTTVELEAPEKGKN